MDRILINDLLKIPDCDIGKTRLKLNVFNGNTDPLEEYKRDPESKKIFPYGTDCDLSALPL